jgi:hypothetical protein
MPNAIEDEVIRELSERVVRGDLNGIDVTYRVTGGAPGEQLVEEEIQLSGAGPVKARARTAAADVMESSDTLPASQITQLLLQISEAAPELTPRSAAHFDPDSIVGQISVKIDGQEASFFFLADKEQAKQHGKVLLPRAARSVGSLGSLHRRILHR